MHTCINLEHYCIDGDSTKNQQRCDCDRWPEANVGQQYSTLMMLAALIHVSGFCIFWWSEEFFFFAIASIVKPHCG